MYASARARFPFTLCGFHLISAGSNGAASAAVRAFTSVWWMLSVMAASWPRTLRAQPSVVGSVAKRA